MLPSGLMRAAFIAAVLAARLAAQQSAGLPAEQIEKIERAVTTEMSRSNIPGLSVAVVTDNRLRWANGYGFADLENFVPAKGATVYRLASISKPLTAVAAMQLVEQGKLDLDAPVQKYCPAFPQKQWLVTTRQLLGHLGGVRHYQSEQELLTTRRYTGIIAALDIFKNDPLLHEPGTKFHYSTYGFNVIGCVVEGAAGVPYADYLREHVFKPAQMDRIRVDDARELIPNRAQGYERTADGRLLNSTLTDTSNKVPGGGLCSTVEDLAKFAVALQSGLLVKPETLTTMWTKQKMKNGQKTSYGLGWQLSERGGVKEVAHGGAQQRVSTYLYLQPEKGVAVVLMANLEGLGGVLPRLAREIADAVSRP